MAEGAAFAFQSCMARHVTGGYAGPAMSRPDLNLLFTLDALLSEGSVARAAKRLRLSPSAMSRALARVRAETGDPLLVRAGRGLVPTPRAIELREQVARIAQEAEAALRPQDKLDVRKLERTFSLRTSDGFVETFGLALVARAGREAPGVKLRFVQKPQRDSAPLREGNVDLETGVVVQALGPELRSQALFRDRFVGVVRRDHPLGRGDVARDDYLSGKHVLVSRRGLDKGPIDDALEALGFTRNVVVIVGGFWIDISPACARGCAAFRFRLRCPR